MNVGRPLGALDGSSIPQLSATRLATSAKSRCEDVTSFIWSSNTPSAGVKRNIGFRASSARGNRPKQHDPWLVWSDKDFKDFGS